MEERVLLQSNCRGFPYLQIRDAAFSLEADCKSASNRSSLFLSADCRNPQERLTDLRISLTPNGLANQYYWTYTTAPSALLGRVELTCESSVVYNL